MSLHGLGRTGWAGLLGVWMAILGWVALPASAELPEMVDRCPFTGRFPVEINLDSPAHLEWLEALKLDIDRVVANTVIAYVDDAQLAELQATGNAVRPIPNAARRAWQEMQLHPEREAYHTYETLTAELQQIAEEHPDITRLISIGLSVQGRELWMMKISDNVSIDEPEPEFKYTATMHGDEPVGTEMCVYLIRLLVEQYGVDPEITAMVDEIEIWIMPLHNPDGNAMGTRYNANGYDLNRTFPDPVDDPYDDPTGRPTEVQHMMYFQYAHNILLGVNFHGGALVMNYPWDSMVGQYAPDHDMITNLCLGYSYRNPPMWNSPVFPFGITVGWEWYSIHGGMQDWAYYWRNEINITGEISNVKWPPSSQLPGFWEDNREAMLWFMGQVRIGVEGFVTDADDGSPVCAMVDVTDIGKPVRGEPLAGFYHRLLEPGTYTLEYSAFGYEMLSMPGVVVNAGDPTLLDVQLERTPWFTLSGVVTEEGSGLPLSAEVAAYRHDSGELIASTSTDPGSGAYALELPAWEYDLAAMAPGHVTATETLELSGNLTLDFSLLIARGEVLMVADANPAPGRLAADLSALGYLVTEETTGNTDPATWADYDLLVWSAGEAHNPVSSSSLRSALEVHVAAGDKLLIEGGEIGYDALENPGYPSFAANVLHISAWDADQAGHLNVAAGQSEHPLATTPHALPTQIQLTYDDYGDEDAVAPLGDVTVVYGTASYPTDAGILVRDVPGRSEGQVVYFAFDYAALSTDSVARDLLDNALTYLASGTQAVADLPVDRQLHLGRPHPTLTRGPSVCAFSLPVAGQARLMILDANGRCVRTLHNGSLAAGTHIIRWDGRDAQGNEIAAGLYFLRATAAGGEASRRLMVVE